MRLRSAGDTLLLIEWDQAIDPAINDEVIALAERLQSRIGLSVRDIVPGYCSLGVHYDPVRTDLEALERAIAEEARQPGDAAARAERPIKEIPVHYGGADGPDLAAVAEWAHCSPVDVIARHAARVYRVYMLGFIPGFAYLGRVDPSIAAPRHRVPRERVTAGSVGIAGEQTGVYPIATPGGWQIIGRTGLVMFDAASEEPSRLRPGDRVRFTPVRQA